MMKLVKVTISKYKSFLNDQTIEIESGVTRLVGKNESGKSAFLEALAKFNYFDKENKRFAFDKTHDYPRSELKIYEYENTENDHSVITCEFSIDKKLLELIAADVGEGVFTKASISCARLYNNKLVYTDFASSEIKFIDNFLSKFALNAEKLSALKACKNLSSLHTKLSEDSELHSIAQELKVKYIDQANGGPNLVSGYISRKYISPALPEMWYFDEYFLLPPQINLNLFQNKTISATFTQEEHDISSSLFSLSGVEVSRLLSDENHEAFIAELEATSNSITDQFLEYWSTNNHLEIQFDIQVVSGQKLLNIRIRNSKHRVTLPLRNRSKGFIWFFSFLVWFSKISKKKNVIILLDEPGLNLHAEAQNDLLRFIEEKLATRFQVIYTTHSPFMIDPAKLHQVRTVYDSDNPKIGSVISSALEEKDKSTLFPLQAALGYDIAQNLYVSQKNLLVEGVADLVYLTLLSNKLRSLGQENLDDDITIVPAGGLDKVATFVSLLSGNKLKIACLLDTFTDQKGKARIDDLIYEKIIKQNNIVFFDEFSPSINPAEIEDMFEVDEYLELFNSVFEEHDDIAIKQIDSNIGIVKQINKIIGRKRFNHYRPANYLSCNPELVDKLSETTLSRFACAFKRVNASLK